MASALSRGLDVCSCEASPFAAEASLALALVSYHLVALAFAFPFKGHFVGRLMVEYQCAVS